MKNKNISKIRDIAIWLNTVSVSSNGNSSTPVTKRDLENFRNKVSEAIMAIADILEE